MVTVCNDMLLFPGSDQQVDDANASATYNYLYGGFNEIYNDGTGASGDWVTDNFLTGGTTVSDLQFGIGYNSSYPGQYDKGAFGGLELDALRSTRAPIYITPWLLLV
jgi:hypothetical protein